jgi:ankyrin repeat protein
MSIHDDARNGDLESLKRMLSAGTDINAQDDEGRTALHYAVMSTNNYLVRYLVERGAEINLWDNQIYTPLDIAEIQLGFEHSVTAYLREKGGTSSLGEKGGVGGGSTSSSSPIWPWLLAFAMIGGQIWYATSGEAFHWPSMFRGLGALSFAAFALMIAMMITNKNATSELADWEIFEILLTPFVGFISCYLTAHVLETFDKIKENTDRLREAD